MQQITHISSPCHVIWWSRVSGLNSAYFEKSLIFLKFTTDSGSPTLYLSESVEFVSMGPELMNLFYMRKRVPGPKNPYFENPKYFSTFLYTPVALHRAFPNHLKLCYYDQNWRTYGACSYGFSNFWFGPKKAASPTLLKTAINIG